MTRYLRFLLLFSVFAVILSCQQDDLRQRDTAQEFMRPNLKAGHRLSLGELKKGHSGAYRHFNRFQLEGLSKSSDGTVAIDTSMVFLIETDSYDSYTFKVIQDSTEQVTMLKNYVVAIYPDSTAYDFTIEYPILPDGSYDTANAVARDYAGSQLFKSADCGERYIESIDWVETCVSSSCGGIDGHSYGDTSCPLIGTSSEATMTCTGAWVTRCSGGGMRRPNESDNGDPGDPGGGGGGGNGNHDGDGDQEEIPIATTPVDGVDNPINLPPENNNCDSTETQRARDLTSLANQPSVKADIKNLNDEAKTNGDEVHFSIITSNGNPVSGGLNTGSGNTSNLNIGPDTVATGHSHPDNTVTSVYAAPSAGDIYALNDGFTVFNNYTTSITVGKFNAYALVIEDPAALAAFMANNSRANTLDQGELKPKTDLYYDFWDTYDILRLQGETPDDAYASAMAYFLANNNIGIGLYESPIGTDGSTNFKKKKTNKRVIPATSTTPEKMVFEKKDC